MKKRNDKHEAKQGERFMRFKEACEYLSLSRNTLYKLVNDREIAVYRPGRKLLYFSNLDLDAYMSRNRCKSMSEIREEANQHRQQLRGR